MQKRQLKKKIYGVLILVDKAKPQFGYNKAEFVRWNLAVKWYKTPQKINNFIIFCKSFVSHTLDKTLTKQFPTFKDLQNVWICDKWIIVTSKNSKKQFFWCFKNMSWVFLIAIAHSVSYAWVSVWIQLFDFLLGKDILTREMKTCIDQT